MRARLIWIPIVILLASVAGCGGSKSTSTGTSATTSATSPAGKSTGTKKSSTTKTSTVNTTFTEAPRSTPTPTRPAKPPTTGPRPPGSVFNNEVGEKIGGKTYAQIVHQFGPPKKTFHDAGGNLCAFYFVVGAKTGWKFCFQHGRIVTAAGNQPPPAGVH
jgi:hypothetical protein